MSGSGTTADEAGSLWSWPLGYAARMRAIAGRGRVCGWGLAALWLGCCSSPAAQSGSDVSAPTAAPTLSERRSAFEPHPVSAPPLAVERSGAAAGALDRVPLWALGDVGSRTVADIGAGRGRRLAPIARLLGPDGRLFATEITESACAALRGLAEDSQLANVSVVLASKTDVGLEADSIDVALLSDVDPFVPLLDGRAGQDKHAFLTSLQRALVPGGEVVVSYVTSSHLKQKPTRRQLLERTLANFSAYGFEPGRRWILHGAHWPALVFEFRWPESGPAPVDEYMGRAIAQTMHWEGAGWLLRSKRASEEGSEQMLQALGVQPGWTVADFGCGNGYHTLELARRTGPSGRVYGVDVQSEMLAMLAERAKQAGLKNVTPMLGSALSADLPRGSCELVLLADVYHELSHPVPTLAVIRQALKPGGRVAVLEFRGEDPAVPIKPDHKMTRAQVLAEFEANGFQLDAESGELPWQHLLFFRASTG